MTGKPCWIWNAIADLAYHDDMHYFYQLNDDIEFEPGRMCSFVRSFVRSFLSLPFLFVYFSDFFCHSCGLLKVLTF